jgi:hypothetical protein
LEKINYKYLPSTRSIFMTTLLALQYYMSLDGWIWIKSGQDKISARGPKIGPKVHHTDEKLKA